MKKEFSWKKGFPWGISEQVYGGIPGGVTERISGEIPDDSFRENSKDTPAWISGGVSAVHEAIPKSIHGVCYGGIPGEILVTILEKLMKILIGKLCKEFLANF